MEFSQKNYDASAYRTHRPDYEDALFEEIYAFHASDRSLALDVACGTGQATVTLARGFKNVIGCDASEVMLSAAEQTAPNIVYKQGTDSQLPCPDGSVDLVTCAQAAHWFDMDKFYKEVKRVLKPTGTLAIWGYGYATVIGNKTLSDAILEYGMVTMAPYWDSRRKILDDCYRSFDLPFPIVYKQILPTASRRTHVRKRMTLGTLENYLKTFSCYKAFKDKHPDAAIDPVETLMTKFVEVRKDVVVDVEWPLTLIMAKLN